jgi:hypothetical protein
MFAAALTSQRRVCVHDCRALAKETPNTTPDPFLSL